MLVTPTAVRPAVKVKCDEDLEQKLAQALKINSLPYSQIVLAGAVSTANVFSRRPPNTQSDNNWSEIFYHLCSLAGCFILTHNQVRSAMNDLYSKHRSNLILSDDIVNCILIRSRQCTDTQILNEDDIQWIISGSSTLIGKSLGHGRRVAKFICSLLCGTGLDDGHYVLIHRALLSKTLAGAINQLLRQGRCNGYNLLCESGFTLVTTQSIISTVLEPHFPALSALPPKLQQLALVYAERELQCTFGATPVKQGLLLIPCDDSGDPKAMNEDFHATTKSSGNIRPLRSQRTLARKLH